MSVRRKFLSVASAIVLAVAALVAGPAIQAQAAPAAWSDCQIGDLCLYSTTTGDGPELIDTSGENAPSVSPQPSLASANFANQTVAVINFTSTSVCFYKQDNFGGNESLYLPNNYSTIWILSDDWANVMNSYRFPGYNVSC